MTDLSIRPLEEKDRSWSNGIIEEQWGSIKIVTRGRIHYANELAGYIVEQGGKKAGLITYKIYGRECEIITMNALEKGIGVGTKLLEAVRNKAVESHCRGIWLITTNDNTDAMRFYQKKGLFLVAVHRDSIKQARKLKPDIPLIGNDGIPVRDEIEMVMPL